MNQFTGKISEVLVDGQLSLVRVAVQNVQLQVALIDNPEQSSYLKRDVQVEVLFKETEVILARPFEGLVSLENRIAAKVMSLNFEKLFCRVSMHSDLGYLNAIITTSAAKSLLLEEGTEVVAFIKTNEIMLSQ